MTRRDPKIVKKAIVNIDKLIENGEKTKMLLYKIKYQLKYDDFYSRKTFWLEGLKGKQLDKPMNEYIKDHEDAFEKRPSWLYDGYIGMSRDSFIGQMKLRWKKAKE